MNTELKRTVIRADFGPGKLWREMELTLTRIYEAGMKIMLPDDVARAPEIARQIIGEVKRLDEYAKYSITLPRPVDANGNFSEALFQASAAKLQEEIDAVVGGLRNEARTTVCGAVIKTLRALAR